MFHVFFFFKTVQPSEWFCSNMRLRLATDAILEQGAKDGCQPHAHGHNPTHSVRITRFRITRFCSGAGWPRHPYSRWPVTLAHARFCRGAQRRRSCVGRVQGACSPDVPRPVWRGLAMLLAARWAMNVAARPAPRPAPRPAQGGRCGRLFPPGLRRRGLRRADLLSEGGAFRSGGIRPVDTDWRGSSRHI